MGYSAYNVIVPPDHELVLKHSHPKELRPRFFMLAVRALELMPELDSNATWLFWKLMGLRNINTNVAVLERKDMTEAEYTKMKRGYLALKTRDVLRRIGHGQYQFNPMYVLPRQGYEMVHKEYSGDVKADS